MAKGIQWEAMRAEYVSTEATYAELAHRYGTSLDAVKKRAGKEKWPEQRHQVSTEIALKTDQKTIDRISDERSEINAKHYAAWGEVIAKLQAALKTTMDLDEIDKLTRSLERAQKGQRLAKDMVTEKTSQEVSISMEHEDALSELE